MMLEMQLSEEVQVKGFFQAQAMTSLCHKAGVSVICPIWDSTGLKSRCRFSAKAKGCGSMREEGPRGRQRALTRSYSLLLALPSPSLMLNKTSTAQNPSTFTFSQPVYIRIFITAEFIPIFLLFVIIWYKMLLSITFFLVTSWLFQQPQCQGSFSLFPFLLQ